MSHRLLRFGTWLAALGMVVANFGPLASHAAASASTNSPFRTLDGVGVMLNEFMSKPQAGTPEFIELYNSTTAPVDLTGWAIATQTGGVVYTFPANALLGSAGYAKLTFTGQLGDSNDTLTLKNNRGADIDWVRYGQGMTAQISAPVAGKSAGRLSDGGDHWYANLTASGGSSNAAASSGAAIPSLAQSVWVKAGSGNRAHIINRSNMAEMYFSVMSADTAVATETVTGELLDRYGVLKAASAFNAAGANTLTVGAINTTASPALSDGAVVVRATVTSTNGIVTAYTYGPTAGRDTVAPAAATAAQVIGTDGLSENNVINSQTVHAALVRVSLPTSSINTDQVRVSLSDGIHSASTDAAINQSGGTLTTSVDATGINDGVTYVQAWLVDSAGNLSAVFNGQVATKDTIAPDGTVTINGGSTVTTGTTVSLAIAASDIGTGVSQMRLANTNDFAGASFETFATSKTWTLLPGEGLRTVYVQFKDGAGNMSPARNVLSSNEGLILVEQDAQSISLVSLATGTQVVRQLPAEATVTATSPTNLTFASYTTNPGGTVPSGTAQVGRFVEIGAGDPTKVTFPVIVKIYYTANDLSAAGVTSETQLQGVAFADLHDNTWKLYPTTSVTTADISVDGQNYAGFAYAVADHLTPMTIVADTTAPVVPADVNVTASNHQVVVSWLATADATNYVVRYRRGLGAFNSVVVSGDTHRVTITNLINGAAYEIQIASRDAFGNTSSFVGSTVTPTDAANPAPVATGTGTVITAPSSGGSTSTNTPTIKPTASPSPTPTSTVTISPTPTPNPTDEEDSASASNYLVVLAVLIIAVGAGTAGWYGYQWWVTRPGASVPSRPTPPTAPASPPVTPQPPVAPEKPVIPPADQPSSGSTPGASTPPTSGPTDTNAAPPKDSRW